MELLIVLVLLALAAFCVIAYYLSPQKRRVRAYNRYVRQWFMSAARQSKERGR